MTRLASVAVGAKVTATIENADRAALNKATQLMTPTSAASGTVGTYGAVTFAAASSVSLNGCFTSEFDWYDVIFDVTTSAAAYIQAALRLSGADAITAYDRQIIVGESATPTTAQSLNQANWRITSTSLIGRHSGTVRLFGPAIAAQTTGTALTGGSANPMVAASGSIYSAFQSHRTLTAYDGITLTPLSGTITGTIRVVGII